MRLKEKTKPVNAQVRCQNIIDLVASCNLPAKELSLLASTLQGMAERKRERKNAS